MNEKIELLKIIVLPTARSGVYGYQFRAIIDAFTDEKLHRIVGKYTRGCGYDKQSHAVQNALEKLPFFGELNKEYKEITGEEFRFAGRGIESIVRAFTALGFVADRVGIYDRLTMEVMPFEEWKKKKDYTLKWARQIYDSARVKKTAIE